MTIPKLTPYTGEVANPDGSQTQSEFTTNMFNQLSYEADLATELDATIDGINNAVDEVSQNTAIAEISAIAAEAAASSAGYQGLWPDTGGSALKGETWQTQVGGAPTGEYYTALQNTSADPVGDNVNWKVNTSGAYVNQAQEELIYGGIFPVNGTVKDGDTVPAGTTHLRVLIGGEPKVISMSPISSGVLSSLTESCATIGSDTVVFSSTLSSTVNSVEDLKKLNYPVGVTVKVKDRAGYWFSIESSGSGNDYDSIKLDNGLFANLEPVPFIDSFAFGCNGTDDTRPFNRALQYSAENNVAIILINQPVLQSPYDSSCYFRVPNGATLKGFNNGNGGSRIQIKPTEPREFGMAIHQLTSLSDPAPSMADSVVLEDFAVRVFGGTGVGGVDVDVDVVMPLVAAQFHCKFNRLKASGGKRHGILMARVWYAEASSLFAFENKGNGLTIGKHPDITGFTDGAVNGMEIPNCVAHSNDLDQTFQVDVQEELGIGISLWGTLFNLSLPGMKTEKNKGAGFMDMSNYGNWSSDQHYTEANSSHGFYIANTASAGKTWEATNIQLQQDESVKIKQDPLTRAKLGIAFAVGGNNIDVSGVNGRQVKVDAKNCSFTMRQALASLIVDYDVVYQQEGNLQTFTNTLFFIGNQESDVPFNYQIVFVPTVTTTSTDTIDTNLYINGVGQGTSQFAGPFTAYEPVVIKSFSGNTGVHYENRQIASYSESCPGLWQVRSKRF